MNFYFLRLHYTKNEVFFKYFFSKYDPICRKLRIYWRICCGFTDLIWLHLLKKHVMENLPLDTGRKLNVHKTFRRRPKRLLNVLCTFNLRPVSTGKTIRFVRGRRKAWQVKMCRSSPPPVFLSLVLTGVLSGFYSYFLI